MRTAVFCALIALALPASAAAAADNWFEKGPYLQNPSSDAVTVVWEGKGARAAEVHVQGREESVRVEPAHRHEVRIEGLRPGERYVYEVRAGEASARGELQAAPPQGVPITFAVMGNTRLDERVQRLVAAGVRGEHPDFVLGTGNLVSEGLSEPDWRRFFEIQRKLFRRAAFFPALGRHDLQGPEQSAEHFQEFFVLPTETSQERYYAFSAGPARFVVLDSNARGDSLAEQTRWLKAELSSAREDGDTRHIFVVSHHGPFSVGLQGGTKGIREAWAGLFEEHQVDAVFSGHDHVYSRAEAGGVRYFVTGGGGAPLYRRRQTDEVSVEATRSFASVHHYLRVDVGRSWVEVNALRIDGTPIESVRWGEPEAPSAELEAEAREFLTPPEPETANTPSSQQSASPAGEPERLPFGIGHLGLGWLGIAALVLGGGALVLSRRA